jgi:phage terminase large subunit
MAGRSSDDARRPYTPLGAARELMYSSAPEVLIDGPKGTGKSRAGLEKVFALCHLWPGSRHVIARKVRRTMSETTLNTWEKFVLPVGHPELKKRTTRKLRDHYRIGESEVLIMGLDDPDKWQSLECDTIFVDEAVQITKEDLDMIKGSLRYGRGAYHQIVLATNPRGRKHHLKRRADDPNTPMVRLRSRLHDNPEFFDVQKNELNARGKAYMAVLDTLTGPRRAWLRDGEWTDMEGVVYPEFDESVHMVRPFEIPRDWIRVRGVDFGFENPLVCQWWAFDPDGRAYMYREIYRSHMLVEDAAREIKELTRAGGDPEESFVDFLCDHDLEDRATLERHCNVTTSPAKKAVEEGIRSVHARLRVQEDGRPRMMLFEGATVEPYDTRMEERHKPTSTQEEFGAYQLKKNDRDENMIKEEPVKLNDHGMDVLRYVSMWADDYFDTGEFEAQFV